MVKSVKIPWGAWVGGDEEYSLHFPDSWNVNIFDIQDAEDIADTKAIEEALLNPIGSPTIKELAMGKERAVVVVEDISRPTKCEAICDLVLQELYSAGIPTKNITFIAATGAHRPMNRNDFIKKLGKNVVEKVNIENHHPYENLVELGKSEMGTPIYLNKTYYQADVKITIGTVIPHPLAGFGGGAKIILPGICGIETLAANHEKAFKGEGIGYGVITDLRKDIEDVCWRVGLDFSINVISTKKRGIAGVIAGHFIDAHRKAVDLGKKVYKSKIPESKGDELLNVGLFNLFPEDTELTQSSKGLNMFMQVHDLLEEESTIVFLTACSEGRGYHSLLSETGGKLHENWKEAAKALLDFWEEKRFVLFSPNLSKEDVFHFWSERMHLSRNFTDLINDLEKRTNKPNVGIFPTSIQLPTQ